jgi:hypothetical protein
MEAVETEEEIEWSYKRNSPYNHHAILHHIPTGWKIEQASDKFAHDAKVACLSELRRRLKSK